MDETVDPVKRETERGHTVRAAIVATAVGGRSKELFDLQKSALWQMAATYRNGPGTQQLAERLGMSKQEAASLLRELSREKHDQGTDRSLEPCFDMDTGSYLSFEEWLDRLLKTWS